MAPLSETARAKRLGVPLGTAWPKQRALESGTLVNAALEEHSKMHAQLRRGAPPSGERLRGVRRLRGHRHGRPVALALC